MMTAPRFPLKIRPGCTAGHVYPAKGENVRWRVVNATINGNHYEMEPADPDKPGWIDVELSYQFGEPAVARLEYTPEGGWTILHPGADPDPVRHYYGDGTVDWAPAHVLN